LRTLDNLDSYALELALLGLKYEAISKWQEVVDLYQTKGSVENGDNENGEDEEEDEEDEEDTRAVYIYCSMASIAEFQDDAESAEILYAKLITVSEAMYGPDHVHILDYRLVHAEQVLRQGNYARAMQLTRAIMGSWRSKTD
jgi:hypothetical protein